MPWLIYLMMAFQLIAWAWHQWKAGQLNNQQYYIFCAGMMLGQAGASIECINSQAWGTLVVQIYFFLWTAVGAVQRYREAGRATRVDPSS